MTNKIKFQLACNCINSNDNKRGIGTYKEKTLHAVLKHYFEPDEYYHEAEIGSFIVDIARDNEIIEIQTQGFNRLRKKLGELLCIYPVTVVYPIPHNKWLLWIDTETGEITKERKSPKKGTPFDCFFELYRIKHLLTNPNLKICIVMLDIKEYRYLDGWSRNRKRGSTRCEQIPIDIVEEILIESIPDYKHLIPEGLKSLFTSKDFKECSRLSLRSSQTALNVLNFVGAVKRVGKDGNAFLYERIY